MVTAFIKCTHTQEVTYFKGRKAEFFESKKYLKRFTDWKLNFETNYEAASRGRETVLFVLTKSS